MASPDQPPPLTDDVDKSSVSDAYAKLVGDDENSYDLVGIVAYTLYKKSKIEQIIASGKSSDHPDIRNYHRILTQTQEMALRSSAKDLLQTYADELKQNFEKSTREEAVNSEFLRNVRAQVDALHRHIQRRTSAKSAIISGVVASFVFAILITLVASIQWQNPFLSFARHSLQSVEKGAVEPKASDPKSATQAPPAAPAASR